MPQIFRVIFTDDEIDTILSAISDSCLICECSRSCCETCDKEILAKKLHEIQKTS